MQKVEGKTIVFQATKSKEKIGTQELKKQNGSGGHYSLHKKERDSSLRGKRLKNPKTHAGGGGDDKKQQ